VLQKTEADTSFSHSHLIVYTFWMQC